MMHKLLNILAGLVVAAGGGLALGCAGVLAAMGWTLVTHGLDRTEMMPVAYGTSLCLSVGFLGCFFAYRAWMHWRKPDAGTARDVVGLALYLTFFGTAAPLLRHHGGWLFCAIVGMVLARYYLNKRLLRFFPRAA